MSVSEADSPRVPDGFFEHCQREEITVLGICYGMQLIVNTLGGNFFCCKVAGV